MQRFVKYLYSLFFFHPSIVLVFSSSGFSFIEKGLYIILGRLLGKKTVLAPRSGLIRDNIDNSVIFRTYARIVFMSANIVLCQGDFWRKYYSRLDRITSVNKYCIQYNWIDESNYLKKVISPSEKIEVLFIGWLEEYKGIFDLLLAFDQLVINNENIYLRICGSGSLNSKIKKWIADKNLDKKILLEGWVNHQKKIEILERADIFVLPSHKEGFPNVLLEAMVSELPIVASRVGIIPEVIKNDINGLLFSTGDISNLTSQISLLINSPSLRGSLGLKARVSVIENHSITSAAKKLSGMFKNLVST